MPSATFQNMQSAEMQPMWKHQDPKSTHIDAFRRLINQKHGLKLQTYAQLHEWSVTEIEAFNKELWSFCGIKHSKSPDRTADGLERMWPPPAWFPGAELNYSENLLATGLRVHPDAVAVSACREGGQGWTHLTWTQLEQQVKLVAGALARAGVTKGDRVCAVSTNSVDTLLALLAAGWIGAIFSSTAPDMGVSGIVERFVQIKPKVLFVETSVHYAGKTHDFRGKFREVLKQLDQRGVSTDLVVDVSNQPSEDWAVLPMEAFLMDQKPVLMPIQVAFDHPIYILYSSGTTGPPKCICHAGGRALLQQKKEYLLHNDMGPGSTYYQYTTTGWMMWNYLVGALSTGARIVLYDGSPLHPTPEYQLQLVQEQGVTHWGTSPKFLSALKQHCRPRPSHFESLRYVVVSGSPLSTELCSWFYSWAPARVGLFSGSGGTDLVGGIVSACPLISTYAGELACANLGMKVEIFDAEGHAIQHTSEKGDLVITRPFLSMPVTFFGDNGDEKYRKAYFDDFPGVWNHGDLIQSNPRTGGYVILGRSDGVLNPGGVRFGTAEIYGIVDKFSEVEDYIAVGQRRATDDDEQVLLFLKMRQGVNLSKELKDRIASSIRSLLSPRHVPSYFLAVRDIPYTLNGKRIENLVRDVVNGKPTKVEGTAVNPECLEEYSQFLDLPSTNSKAKL